jgi:hypothetical protein
MALALRRAECAALKLTDIDAAAQFIVGSRLG